MQDLTGFQRDLLYCIAGLEEPYGLGIKQALKSYREVEINHARLYSNLNTLVEKEYIDKSSLNGRKKSYELTAGGRQLLVERQEWEAERLPEQCQIS
jgi:DNA-binding PadR family transcriptional regulator